jgi:hypothetical protein
MKAALIVAMALAPSPAVTGPAMPTCEQMRRAEDAPASCRAPLVIEAMHPWSGLRSLEESEAWLAAQCAPAKRLRDDARRRFLERNREAIAGLARWFDAETAGDGDWSALFFGRHPTVCEKIQNAPNR